MKKHKQTLTRIHEGHLGLGSVNYDVKTLYIGWGSMSNLSNSSELQIVLEILKSKKQTSSICVIRTRSSNTPMDKSCY